MLPVWPDAAVQRYRSKIRSASVVSSGASANAANGLGVPIVNAVGVKTFGFPFIRSVANQSIKDVIVVIVTSD